MKKKCNMISIKFVEHEKNLVTPHKSITVKNSNNNRILLDRIYCNKI